MQLMLIKTCALQFSEEIYLHTSYIHVFAQKHCHYHLFERGRPSDVSEKEIQLCLSEFFLAITHSGCKKHLRSQFRAVCCSVPSSGQYFYLSSSLAYVKNTCNLTFHQPQLYLC